MTTIMNIEALSPRTREQFEKEPDLGRLSQAYAMISTDWPRALAEFKQLADNGSVMSMLYVADVYSKGAVTSRDVNEYERWLVRARDAGAASGAYKLGLLYLQRNQDNDAVENILLAAKRNYTPAFFLLGKLYEKGGRVTKDIPAAKAFLEDASRRGHSLAKRDLAKVLIVHNFGMAQKIRAILLYLAVPWEIMKIASRHSKLSSDGSSFQYVDENID